MSLYANAQDHTYISGKVMVDGKPIEGVHVFNKTGFNGGITSKEGFFEIKAKAQDTLLFSSISYKMKEVIITNRLIHQRNITVQMTPIVYELDEVVIRPYHLSGFLEHDMKEMDQNTPTASSLGLPNANVPAMSYSEKKIYSLRNHNGVLFALINGISGRTKKNNKIIAIIRKQDSLKKVKSYYQDSLFVNALKIPHSHIDGFMYYCEADSSFQKIIESENKLIIWEFLTRKSTAYRQLLRGEDHKRSEQK
ncbi:carboxypeptidase-like regulatory domain-containing protein [Galbibacter sp. EGI 63066]|uniref:carboxypeptidase-like regulatory domain-containing protein n=1 Tax=Galbibacter sp. EGI 63066 TaxID=2993559 RepID=UPI00224920FF|nr:carboxypeptidase-like regulatory domain-containing protein [Galbibacter sp. EGI 63066]